MKKPKQNDNLTQEEKDILASYEAGEWRSIQDPTEVERLVQSAKSLQDFLAIANKA